MLGTYSEQASLTRRCPLPGDQWNSKNKGRAEHSCAAGSLLSPNQSLDSPECIDGRTVLEQPGNARSPAEIAELWRFLKARLGRKRRTAKTPKKAPAAKPRNGRSITKKAA